MTGTERQEREIKKQNAYIKANTIKEMIVVDDSIRIKKEKKLKNM